MKRLIPTGLALLLVVGSLGHVFAAAFCPRSQGRECCAAKTSKQKHDSSSCHHDMSAPAMPMDGMSMDDMTTKDAAADVSKQSAQRTVDANVAANMLEQPDQFCAHCLS